MSAGLLALLRRLEHDMYATNNHVLRTYGRDGALYPRDFHRPAALLVITNRY